MRPDITIKEANRRLGELYREVDMQYRASVRDCGKDAADTVMLKQRMKALDLGIQALQAVAKLADPK